MQSVVEIARGWISDLPELTCEQLAAAIIEARQDGRVNDEKALLAKYVIRQREEEMAVRLARLRVLEDENAKLKADAAQYRNGVATMTDEKVAPETTPEKGEGLGSIYDPSAGEELGSVYDPAAGELLLSSIYGLNLDPSEVR